MDLQFLKGTTTFWDVVGLPNMAGRSLGDVVPTTEKEKLAQIRAHFHSEQKGRALNYTPAVLENGFYKTKELELAETSRFPLEFYGRLVFVGANGYASPMSIRAGLAEAESFCFIILLLEIPHRQSLVFHAPSAPILEISLPYRQPGSGKGFARRAPFDPVGIHSSEGFRLADSPPPYMTGPTDCNEYISNHRGRPFGVTVERRLRGGQPHPATHNKSTEQIESRPGQAGPVLTQWGRMSIRNLID
jgi:hypothetical protein